MSLLFDGTDDRVVMSDGETIDLTTGTYAAVIRRDASAANRGLIQRNVYNSAFNIWDVTAGDTMRILGGTDQIETTGLVPESAWVFLAYSKASDTSHRFYCYNYESLTEVFNETSATNIGTLADTGSWKIGVATADDAVFENFFNGRIAWIGVWTQDYSGLGGDYLRAIRAFGPYALAAPKRLWPFLETTGTTTRELSTGANATLTNFPGSPWEPMSLPGPWWERKAARVIRPQGVQAPPPPVLSVISTGRRRRYWVSDVPPR